MPTVSPTCPTCATPLPEGAKYCPSCGAASPVEINRATGEAHWPTASDADELEYRQRLQQALGDAYQLRELIGRGGFGAVYVARDVKLEREVAVKALRHDLFPTRLLLERFQREARAVARLRHPHIIPMYAVGGGEGLAYMIMPRIEGESLSAVLTRDQRLPIRDARRILIEAAGALHAAHKHGIVHRDVKPENILLEGDERRVLLVDFGIAKAVTAGETGLTGTGMAIGTPDYMSPEQASGARAVDHRSDQYALAVVGYRMLTGTLPFEAVTSREALYKRMAEAPPAARTLRPEVPAFLSDALRRAMAEGPDERYGSMEEFAVAISGGEAAVAQGRGGGVPTRGEQAVQLTDPRAPAIGRPLAALALLGAIAFALLYLPAFPPELGAPAITREDAVSIGRTLLVEAGAVPLKEAVRFESRPWDRGFLERALGRDSARRWLATQGNVLGRWSLRWFAPRQIEGWSVGISGDGAIDFFQHTIDDAAAGAHLDAPAARAVAESFLRARGWDPGQVDALSSSRQQRPNRTDHAFTWRKRGSTITWDPSDAAVTPASILVEVQVQGQEVGLYRRSLAVPPEASRTLRIERAETIRGPLTAILMIGVPLLVLGIVVARGRANAVRWAPALVAGVVFLLDSIVEGVNAWPAIRYDYWAGDTMAGFFLDRIQEFVWGGVFRGGFLCIAAAVGEYIARDRAPGSTAGYVEAFRGRVFAPAVIRAGVAGCALGLVIMGFNALFWGLARNVVDTSTYLCPTRECVQVSTLTPALDVTPYAYADHVAPFVAGAGEAVFWALIMALASWFFITIALRYVRSATAAVLGVGALFAFLAPWVYPTALGSLGSGVVLVIFGFIILRFGVLACMAAVYFSESAAAAIAMLVSPQSGLALSGVALLVLAFLPMLPWLLARRRGLAVPMLIGLRARGGP